MLYASTNLTQYILLAAFLNKTAAINLIDKALEMKEDINVGLDKDTLSLLETLSTSNTEYQLNEEDRHDVMGYLLEKGANPTGAFIQLIHSANRLFRETPGSLPMIFNSLEILLSHTPNLVNQPISYIFEQKQEMSPPLMFAIININPSLMHFLLQQPNINANFRIGNTGPVGVFIRDWQRVADETKLPIFQSLLEAKAPVYDRHPGSTSREPMEEAVVTSQNGIITLLASHGAAVNYRGSNGRYAASPLMRAILSPMSADEKITIIRTLLEAKANINELAPLLETAAMIDRGIEVNLAEPLYTPLYSAISSPFREADRIQLIDFLLENNADPNIRSADANFPLHIAISRQYDSAIERLITIGDADPTLQNDRNQTAFMLADLIDAKLSQPRYRLMIERFIPENPTQIAFFIGSIALISGSIPYLPWYVSLPFSVVYISFRYQNLNYYFLRQTAIYIYRMPLLMSITASILCLGGITMPWVEMIKSYYGRLTQQPRRRIPQARQNISQLLPQAQDPAPSLPVASSSSVSSTSTTNTEPTAIKISIVGACRTGNLPEVQNT